MGLDPAHDLSILHEPRAVESGDRGFLNGALGADGEADELEEIDGEGSDDAHRRVAQPDHLLVVAREGGKGGFEEETVSGERGGGEGRVP